MFTFHILSEFYSLKFIVILMNGSLFCILMQMKLPFIITFNTQNIQSNKSRFRLKNDRKYKTRKYKKSAFY